MGASQKIIGASLEERVAALGLDPSKPNDVVRAAARARELRATVARHDPNVFCRYVLRDERNGRPILQAPLHKKWHELMNQHDRLVMWSHVEGGKTTQIPVGRVLWELGRNPALRVCVVSNTADLAKKMTRQVGQYIEKSAELHEVFPDLVPTEDPSLPWKAQALTVRRPGIGARDPSVQATGVHGNIIGSRVDLLILDDILDHENTHTPGPREDVIRWIKSSLFSRLTEGARVWIVGNAWHPEDAMHKLEKEERFRGFRFPVIDPKTKELTWPERWSHERIELARKDLGPLEYARQLLCQARDDTSSRFKKEWIDECIKKGEGLAWCENIAEAGVLEEFEEGLTDEERQKARETIWRLSGNCAVVTGVDLAVQRGDSHDETVLFTILVQADGTRRVLNIRSGKWTGPEIIKQIKKAHDDFGSIVVVENNAAQDYILQFLRDETAVPVKAFTTGKNKAHPEFGVESLATELANLKWAIPSRGGQVEKEISDWIAELLFYDPREHTGDRVMASWFAREGARFFDGGGGGRVGVRIV